MNKTDLVGYLERLDRALTAPATLHIYGSAAFMLLDEPERTSLVMENLENLKVDMTLWGGAP
jgi:hypothetical protein